MKKLIFLLLFVGFFSSADEVCKIYISDYNEAFAEIKKKCQKGDILTAESNVSNEFAQMRYLQTLIEHFCNFDKEIIFKGIPNQWNLMCVLNSTEPRRFRG
jgi:hypothetical protein